MKQALGIVTILLAFLLMASPAEAKKAEEHKVTICHRTNSVTNPYVIITVDSSAADDGTDKSDHAHHDGPVFDFSADPSVAYPPPHNGDQWGDIIPPHESFPGQNWTSEGRAIYDAGCARPAGSTTTTIAPTTTTAAPTTTTAPSTTPTTVRGGGNGHGHNPSTTVPTDAETSQNFRPTSDHLARTGSSTIALAIIAIGVIAIGYALVRASKARA